MLQDIEKVLISKEQIAKKVAELGEKISKDYNGLNPVLISILKGSSIFFADLMRQIKIPLEIDFLAVSSYGSSASTTGEVKLIKDLDASIDGRHVIIVEDIVDTGLTLNFIKEMLLIRNARSVKVCTLLDKSSRREKEIAIDYTGFEVENHFLVGYGLDYAEKYRNLPDVCILKIGILNKDFFA